MIINNIKNFPGPGPMIANRFVADRYYRGDQGTKTWTLSGITYSGVGTPVPNAKVNIYRSGYFAGTDDYLGNLIIYGDCSNATTPPQIFTQTGGVVFASFARDTAQTHNPVGFSYKLISAGSTPAYYYFANAGVAQGNLSSLSIGHSYTLYTWVYVTTSVTSLTNVYLKVDNYFNPITLASIISNSPIAYNTWQQLVLNFTIPNGTTTTALYLTIQETGVNETLWIDDVVLTDNSSQQIPLADTVIATTTSNANGVWSAQMPAGGFEYYVLAYYPDSPDLVSISLNTVKPT